MVSQVSMIFQECRWVVALFVSAFWVWAYVDRLGFGTRHA